MVAVDWPGGMGILRFSCGHGDGCLSEQGVSGEWGGAIEARCDRELRQTRSLKPVRVLCAGADWWRDVDEVSGLCIQAVTGAVCK